MIKSRRMRSEGHVARIGAKRNADRILVGKPERKRPLGRPRQLILITQLLFIIRKKIKGKVVPVLN
jgi:hypothetical protein